MLSELPSLNKHFHAHATRYQAGDIVILIDGSEEAKAVYDKTEKHGAAIQAAVDAAALIRLKLNPRTRAFFYGKADGPREIKLTDERHLRNVLLDAPGKNLTELAPTLEQIRKEYPDATPEKPLHIIIISAGGSSDPEHSRIQKSIMDLLMDQGKQVLMNFIFTTKNTMGLARVSSTAFSKMLDGGKSKYPDKPAPDFHQAYSTQQLLTEIATAINKRTAPPDPDKFMVDLVCETVRKGTCRETECPLPASFAKKPK